MLIKRGLFFLLLYSMVSSIFGQSCSTLLEPINGATNVPVSTKVSWSKLPDIIGFVVSFGTTPGGGEIIENRSSGTNNFYIPETGLPVDTQIYVTVGYYKKGQDFTTCDVQTFRTANATSEPKCTTLSTPMKNAINISAETTLRWNYSPTATGYLLSVATEPNIADIFDKFDVGNVLNFTPPNGLPADRKIYVTIWPYNDIGIAKACTEEIFTTTSAVIDCGPYFDYMIGKTVMLGPELSFPEIVGLCENSKVTTVTTDDITDGYRWYALDADGNETLISSEPWVDISTVGKYRYEAYNFVTKSTNTFECATSQIFEVTRSGSAIITSISETDTGRGRRLEINTTGSGIYEFALDHSEGPYQNENIFDNVSTDFHSVFVRDKKGCGITESSVQRKLSTNDFPKFFTPNGDNVNDHWQFIVPEIAEEIVLSTLEIFDRYGNQIAVVNPTGQGWDGTFNGIALPASDYWFMATTFDGDEMKGHFTLKR